MFSRILSSSLMLACLPGAFAQAGRSESVIEEVVVTAQKRAQTAQSVPISLYAVRADRVDELGARLLEDLRDQAAGVEIVGGSPGRMQVAMRGVTSLAGPLALESTAAVGFYLDEMPLSGFSGEELPELDLWDIERIEFLRGPQGTLFGEGSIGGTIRAIAKRPDPTAFSGELMGEFVSVNEGDGALTARGVVNIPLIEDRLALRASFSHRDLPGWIDIPDLAESDTNDGDQTHLRLMLGWQPTDRLDLQLTYIDQELDLDGTYESTEPYRLNPRTQGAGAVRRRSTQDSAFDIFNLTVSYDLGFASLVSATSFFDQRLLTFDDLSPVAPLFFGGVPGSISDTNNHPSDVLSQELRLVSADDQQIDWTVGLFYKTTERSGFQTFDIEVPDFALVDGFFFRHAGDARSVALFADIDWTLTDNWSFKAGARYFDDERDFMTLDLEDSVIFGVVAGTRIETRGSDSDFSPHLGLTWQEGNHLFFGRIAKGFRPGGTNPNFFFRPDEIRQEYSPDELWSYEIGSKNEFSDGRIRLNGYLYYNDWSDIQIARTTDDSLFLFVDNAAEAEVLGGEVELLAQPSPELTLMLNAAITRAEFTSDLVQGGVVVVADGNEIPFVPDFSLGASVNYIRPLANGLDGVLSANYAHRSTTFSNASNSPLEENDSYNQLGLRAGVEGHNWGLYARVTNALDEEDTTFKVNPVLGFPITYSTYVRPRTYGLEVRWRF